MEKELCKCGKMAVWIYMPGYSKGQSPFHCDDCVPRGCACEMWSLKEMTPEEYYKDSPDFDKSWVKYLDGEYEGYWVPVDDMGRKWPCCEYHYDEEGFDLETNGIDVIEQMYEESKNDGM